MILRVLEDTIGHIYPGPLSYVGAAADGIFLGTKSLSLGVYIVITIAANAAPIRKNQNARWKITMEVKKLKQIKNSKSVQDLVSALGQLFTATLPGIRTHQIITIDLGMQAEERFKEIEKELKELKEYVRFYHG